MKNLFLSLFFIFLASVLLTAQKPETLPSRYDFETTVEELKETISSMDLRVIAEVPHSKGAEMSGLELPPTHLLIFGNPKVGSLLMQEDQGIGLDLPLRMVIFERDGQTFISYRDPRGLESDYDLGEQARILGKMNQVLGQIAEKVRAESGNE